MARTMLAHRDVVVGIDTHQDVHVAVALDTLGGMLGTVSVRTTPDGFHQLLRRAETFEEIRSFGIEGTGGFGATLTRFLVDRGRTVFEVARPSRQLRRAGG